MAWEQDFLAELCDYVGFTEEHARLLAELRPLLRPSFVGIVAHFYEAIERVPRAAAVFTGGKPQIERQKVLLAGWLEGLFSGLYDVEYLRLRARIGRTHVRIGLAQRYMFAAMNLVRAELHQALDACDFSPARRPLAHAAIDKICDLELAIMLETYSQDHAERLREQERLATLGKLAGSVEACILGLDARGEVRFANRFAHERLVAHDPLVGRELPLLCLSKDARSITRALEQVVAGQTVRDVDGRVQVAGRTRTVRWTFTPLELGVMQKKGHIRDERELTVLATGIDITDRLALELKTSEAEAMATMGVLTTGLAHEIRNPLNAAKLQLELLMRRAKKTIHDGAPDQLVEPANLVKAEIDRLAGLLDEFLYLARPRPLERRKCPISALFSSVCELEAPVAKSAGASLRTSITPGDLEVRADPDKLKQVLINLVTNAVDAVREKGGGEVLLSAEPRDDGGVTITVADDGGGVPEEVAENAFKPFVTSKPAGTGLGLAIVQKIVALHGGSAELLARPTGGTLARFHVSA